MIDAIFQSLSQAITGATGALSSAVTSIVAVFWTAGENGSAGAPTFLGVLLIIGIAFALAYLCFRLIRGAVRGMAR